MTAGMNLTGFLRARIAEDETDIGSSQLDDPDASRWLPAMVTRDRLKAECEAKRRIIDLADEHTDSADPIGHLGTMYYTDDYEEVLRALALPYADHPDYRKVGMS
jgi:hypothetical protein